MSGTNTNLIADESDCGSNSDIGCGNENASECGGYNQSPIQNVVLPGYNSEITNKLSILLKDLYATDSTCQCVNLAVVSNYIDDTCIDESKFFEIKLAEIKISYDCFVKIFFNDVRKGFSPQILGTIWKGIKNFPLASIVLEKYEEHFGIQRDKIPAIQKIYLHKQCAFSNLNTIIKKSFGLTQNEFNCALGSVDAREDGNICTNITINLYFPSLEIGLRIIMRFAVSCVPEHLIGKVSSDDTICFDFNSGHGSDCIVPAEITFEDTGVPSCDRGVDVSNCHGV
jgi:hypothetical protein